MTGRFIMHLYEVEELVPVFEGVVDDGPQQQSIPDLGGPSEGEHVDGSQSGMSLTQPTAPPTG